MPVVMLVAFTRVTVGKTECECVYQTPAPAPVAAAVAAPEYAEPNTRSDDEEE